MYIIPDKFINHIYLQLLYFFTVAAKKMHPNEEAKSIRQAVADGLKHMPAKKGATRYNVCIKQHVQQLFYIYQ